MEKEYYVVEGDRRIGPLSITQLAQRGLEPSSLVWTAGLADWTRADNVPELAGIISNRTRIDEQESAFGGYAQKEQPAPSQYYKPQQQYGMYGNGNMGPGYASPQNNWKTLAIVATVAGFIFSCLGGIIGIIAWVNASKAENAMRVGADITAQNAWSTCRTLCIISFVITGIGLVFNILYVFGFISLNKFLM